MLRLVLAAVGLCLVVESSTSYADGQQDLQTAKELLDHLNKKFAMCDNKYTLATWDYDLNSTNESLAIKLNILVETAKAKKEIWEAVNAFPWQNITDMYVKRQFSKLSTLGYAVLPQDQHRELEKVISNMVNIYRAKSNYKCQVCDQEKLKQLWVKSRKVISEKVKHLYPIYVQLSNAAARLNNFPDVGAYWLKEYETHDFPQQIETVWQTLKPLYYQLHAYVRSKLWAKYGDNIVSKDGPIPEHLLGNMWSNVVNFSIPFPRKHLPDVTEMMREQGYNPTSMFRLAEDFFVSMNLSAMPDTFWKNSFLEVKENRDMNCHPTAWDFFDGKDFRILQCTHVNMQNLFIAHHEMGHIQYCLQYKDQPAVFRAGANPGFHEAVGDVITLSVSTPNHLKALHLLNEDNIDYEVIINNLYAKALRKIAFLPFAHMLETWRWNVFEGKVTPDNYNCHWWNLAEQFQGIEPPVHRSDEDFDPGAWYHIIANKEYIRYYVSHIIQFQFHKALCMAAKQYDPVNPSKMPLYQCDIYNNKDAGNLLKSMLEMGSSEPWQDAMEKITGQRKMDSAGLLEYFEPLFTWLKLENQKTNEYIGWKPSRKQCLRTRGKLVKQEV